MKLALAEQIALKMLKSTGLADKGWTFFFDKATSRLGATHYGKKAISLSPKVTLYSEVEEVVQTLIHECAHALLPASAGHGPEWKALAAKLGYKGKRLARNPYIEYQMSKGRYPVRKKSAKTQQRRKPVAVAVQNPNLPPVGIGTKIQVRPGVTGTIFKKARTCWHINADDGKTYRIRFEHAPQYALNS